MPALAYLDASAVVKLVVEERESSALRRALRVWPGRVSSALAIVEVHRAVRRRRPAPPRDRVDTVLSGLTLVPLEREVLTAAAVLEDPALRALDALHVATAASLEADLGVLLAYDDRLLAAARSLGLPTDRPSGAGT